MDLLRLGVTGALRGLRQGNTAMSLGGIVLALLGWRRSRSGRRKLLRRIVLGPGEQVSIRVAGKDREPLRVP